ncbi:MAG: nucleotidyltransferase family protein, partial [Anaeroplasmataceae bacterium]|nr:nucleotidyltransferase family protein [Anaeroplasmataceae bacterium]
IYALNEIKRLSQADVLVAVLSGNFTMRGDLSIFDKFEKARQALKAGIDVVIELPFACAVQNADRFAKNAVRLLHLAKVSELWIGSESNNPDLYEECYQDWLNPESQEKIKELLELGKSYKEATSSIIHLPSNDLLGYSYYKAIKEAKYPITIHTIKRIGSYDSLEAKEYASAYAIRNDLSLMKDYCPNYVNPSLIRDYNFLFPYLKYEILNSSIEELKQILFVEEGLEHRIKEITSYNTFNDFINFLSTKRYTKSRIQRMLSYILFHITKQELQDVELSFLRILGYSSSGKAYLNQIKKEVSIYTNIKEGIHPVLDMELKITKILDLIYSTSLLKIEQGKPQEI